MAYSTAPHAQPLHYLQSRKSIPALGLMALRVAVVLTKWEQRRRTRTALLHLSDHHLKDIGLTRSTALKETRKKFWQD
ncbi:MULTISPECIES: DUF1127 domain-containing protein [Halocynthiibacter]|uniref:DUF1127 domain-containing protein n=1 Tax=Halocynthiibacter halioticoli TaxID=2986804 RepID=A0AAE3J0T3_9RHOB|nr:MULTISPECIES: DUF1127 domain-containing protein [Halocynthiibacter]MCV6824421.1 DUF1127 domain-containing protein [Halocynthiibacter halioticoli]MCW4057422.1 DUF1127 domain-containing protein [Halocynthiibacter sp. SDUM655004]MDE0589541.1 DUF1127 domain-containing protein [Halocynthiibacter sp. C4]